MSITSIQNTPRGRRRILKHSLPKTTTTTTSILTPIILPKPLIFTTPLALLNLFDNASRSHSLASEEVILHMVAGAAFAREPASVLYLLLVFAFVFACVLAKIIPP